MAKQEIQVTGIDALSNEVRNAIELNKKNTVVNPDLAKKILVELNQDPPQNEIQINKMANNSKYLPISFIETKLDELFYGLWSTTDLKIQVVANEIIGWLELEYYAPWADKWLKRTGCGSVQIQMDSGLKDDNGNQIWENKKKVKDPNFRISDIDRKIQNTLTKDFPHLKSECLKNACRSIGKIFGRDLNREFEDFYNPMESMEERIEANNPKFIDKETCNAIESRLVEARANSKQIKYLLDKLNISSFANLTEDKFETCNKIIEAIAEKNKELANG